MMPLRFNRITPVLKQYHVAYAALFGSYAKGTATAKSDVDLLVRFRKPVGFFELVRLEQKLSKKLHRPVDIVTEKALSPHIRDAVLSEALRIYGR
jgi:hypothetical protein